MEGHAARAENAQGKSEDGLRCGEGFAAVGMDRDRTGVPLDRGYGRREKDAGAGLFRAMGEMEGKKIVTVDGACCLIAIDFVFGLLLAGEGGDADATRIGCVEALDEGARPLGIFCTGLTAFEKVGEAHVSFAAETACELLEKIEGSVVLGAGGERAMGKAGVGTFDGLKRGVCVVQEVEQIRRAAVDKFCAEF